MPSASTKNRSIRPWPRGCPTWEKISRIFSSAQTCSIWREVKSQPWSVYSTSGMPQIVQPGSALRQMARRNATRFVLVAVSQPALRVLQLARLDKVFTLAESLEAALAT